MGIKKEMSFDMLENVFTAFTCIFILFLIISFCYSIYLENNENNEHHDERIKIVNVKHVVFHNSQKYSFFVVDSDGYENPLTIIFKDNPKIKRDVNDGEMCWVDYGKWQGHNYVIDNMSYDFGFNAVIHLHQDTEMTAGENSYHINKHFYTEQPKFME